MPELMPTKKRKRTILVVDDEKSDRETMRRTLEEAGYAVLEAADFHQAVDVHQRHLGEIDLLLTAIALPGNNGYELARRIFQIDPNPKVLFVSGYTGAEVSRFYNMPTTGAHLLDKPVQRADLLDRVRHVTRVQKQHLHAKGAS